MTKARRSPEVSSNDGSAKLMEGIRRASLIRDQGMSIDFGFGMFAIPMAPAAFRYFQRSAPD